MSQLKVDAIHSEDGGSSNIELDDSRNTTCKGNLTVDGNIAVTGTGLTDTLSFRNLIRNGAMKVNQRGAYTGQGTSGKYGTDGWELKGQASGMVHSFIHQDTGMNEFPKCLRMDCTTAATGAVTEVKITQQVEGQDLGAFKFGTSSAESITVSFWCRSTQASTFVVWMHRDGGGRHNAKTFAISAADTWEKKTITFSPDTSGTPTFDNERGFQIAWVLNSGTGYTSGSSPNGTWEAITDVNRYAGITATIGGNTNDYFDLTGVQVETGTTATEFEHRSFGDELVRCQRYLQVFGNDGKFYTSGATDGNSNGRMAINLGCPLRASPTVKTGGSTIRMFLHDDYKETTSTPSIMNFAPNSNQVALQVGGYSGLTSGRVATFMYKDENKDIFFSGDDKNLALEAEL